ncbi:hypothetical protein N656DRAFT_752982 [Canariomyces notabilis]|uniref:Zn(2)-C6 fungal-type domain-containing protein n=1 Tax=Canariomyces notabilis TaxID=2074819 RepID=A0AAN6YSI3_9PEZI|nr:hypothetical protein N656DRAFT_752982 [Canariomyces arenarius]
MVGVPGRSQACSTCRERKVSCDAAKPHCNRCVRTGRQCGGYQRPRVFVNQFSETQTPLGSNMKKPRTRRHAPKWAVYCAPIPGSDTVTMSTALTAAALPKSPDPHQPQQHQLIAQLIQAFCPPMDPTLRPSERIHHYWVHCLPSIHGRGFAVLDKAIMTLCAGFLGRVMSDECLQQRAMTMYGEALRGLSTVMAAPNFVASDSLLAAVMCLGMAEVYSAPTQPAQDIGWASHNKGGCELLVSRGASILQSELGRGLLLRFRVTGVWTQLVYEPHRAILNSGSGTPTKQLYTAVGKRKPFPFADPQLRQISKAANQNYYDSLIDAMVDIPGLLHDLDTLRQGVFISKDDLQDILARSKATTAGLGAWLVEFLAENRSAYHCVCVDRPRPRPHPRGDRAYDDVDLFPHAGAFRFQNLLAAQAVTHFWAALVVLARCVAACQALSRGSADMDLEREVDEEEAIVTDPRVLGCCFADMICSTAGYFTARERGMSGPIILLFPLWIAKDMYANMHDDMARRKEAFCLEVFSGLAARGMKISDALMSLSTKTP